MSGVGYRAAAFALALGAGLAVGGASGFADPVDLGPVTLRGNGPSFLDLGAGVYDLIGNAHRNETGAAEVEFRYGQKLYNIGPAVGVIGDLRGGGMVYAGIYSDFALGPIVITPLGGFGAWWHGASNDENLGGTFEFRLQLEVSYEFDNAGRIGVRFGHISNADIHKSNPGDNDVMLTYAAPLSF